MARATYRDLGRAARYLLHAWPARMHGRAMTAARLGRRQARRLRALVAHAAAASPYYQRLFAGAGIDPAEILSPEALRRLPVLAKQTVREQSAAIVTPLVDLAHCRRRPTAGTTGSHVEIPVSPLEYTLELLLWQRGYAAYGLRPWQRQAKLALPQHIPARTRAWQRCGLLRRSYLPVLAPPDEKVAWLRRTRPHALFCWSSMLNEISFHLARTGTSLRIPLLFVTSDTLWPDVRQRAEERLGGRVIDIYGSVETGPIAWQCPSGSGYHVQADDTIVELLDDAGQPTRQGQVVCTVLWRLGFPLLRYALGDSAAWADAPCPCGSPFPLLQRVEGRYQPLLHLPGGAWLSAARLKAVILEAPGVRQFQFVQEAPARFLLRVVAGPAFAPEVERRTQAEFERVCGQAARVRMARVAEIRQPPEAKFSSLVTQEMLAQIARRGGDIGVFFQGT